MKLKNNSGFTLIELLVVIAIIGLLASVVLVALNSARTKSRDAKRLADMNQMIKAMELYFNECNSYPVVTSTTTITGNLSLYTGSTANCGTNRGATAQGGIGSTPSGTTLAPRLPIAPTPADSSICLTGTNNSYKYRSYDESSLTTPSNSTDTSAAGYVITFCLGNKTGDILPGLRMITQTGFK